MTPQIKEKVLHYFIRWTLDSRVLAVHCVPRHQNGGLLLSLSQQAHYMWPRFGIQLDQFSSSVGRELVWKANCSRFESGLLLYLYFFLLG